MSTDALHHLIINLDVQGSGQRTDPGQLILRDVVHDVVQSAFAETRIDLSIGFRRTEAMASCSS
ncbi:MAG: hypothetical protein M3460_23630 [Actinomycetota bacterium]|nr:hypothetical protein [Actinomycetota bacterium]